LLLFNKTDAMTPEQLPRQQSDVFELEGRRVPRVFASARTGSGLGELRRLLAHEVDRRDAPEATDEGEIHESSLLNRHNSH